MFLNYKFNKGKEKEIPFFPLSIIVVPGEQVPLRIFEPRYIQLINNIKNSGEPFAIPYIKDSNISGIGSIVNLKKIEEQNQNGQMIITIEGYQLCEILNFKENYNNKLYGGGSVIPFPDKFVTDNPTLLFYIKQLDWQYDNSLFAYESMIDVYALINKLQIDNFARYQILSAKNISTMENSLLTSLKYYNLLNNQEKLLRDNFELN